MKLSQHILFWIIATIFSVFVMTFMFTNDEVQQSIKKDFAKIEESFGEEVALAIRISTNNLYYRLFSTQDEKVKALYVNDNENPIGLDFITNLSKHTNAMIDTAKLNVYHLLLRLNVLLAWMPMILIMITVSFIDGLVTRKIKAFSFGYSNPVLHNLAAHVAISTFGFSMMLFHLPISVTPYYWLFAGVVVAMAVMIATGNLQRLQQ